MTGFILKMDADYWVLMLHLRPRLLNWDGYCWLYSLLLSRWINDLALISISTFVQPVASQILCRSQMWKNAKWKLRTESHVYLPMCSISLWIKLMIATCCFLSWFCSDISLTYISIQSTRWIIKCILLTFSSFSYFFEWRLHRMHEMFSNFLNVPLTISHVIF